MSKEIVKRKPTKLKLSAQPASTILELLASVARNGKEGVENLKELHPLYKEERDVERQAEFSAALVQLQASIPPIRQDGVASIPGQIPRRYATLNNIKKTTKPLMAKHGFALTTTERVTEDGKREYSGELRFQNGIAITAILTLEMDKSGNKNAVQASSSTLTYGRRNLYKMLLDIDEDGDDTDGIDPEPIDEEQVKDLEALIEEVKADKERFLTYMEVDALSGITAGTFKKAVDALEVKRGQQ